MAPAWKAVHRRALQTDARHYTDPDTGYLVFTELSHLDRGTCCGAGCRHCPWAHARVPPARRREREHAPTLFDGHRLPRDGTPVDVVAWSGGKDSWLAWQTCTGPTVWLSTYDPASGTLPIQGVDIDSVHAQAEHTRVPLVTSPVSPQRDVVTAFRAGLDAIAHLVPVARVVFGDLWLPEIPEARREALGDWVDAHGATLAFPLWGMSADALLPRLFRGGPRVLVRASDVDGVRPGDPYDETLVSRLPPEVDPMGERGELHTEVVAEDLAPLR